MHTDRSASHGLHLSLHDHHQVSDSNTPHTTCRFVYRQTTPSKRFILCYAAGAYFVAWLISYAMQQVKSTGPHIGSSYDDAAVRIAMAQMGDSIAVNATVPAYVKLSLVSLLVSQSF